jgi:hypothetical protein
VTSSPIAVKPSSNSASDGVLVIEEFFGRARGTPPESRPTSPV